MRDYGNVSFIKRGKNRLKVFMAVEGTPMPSELVIKIYGRRSNTYFNIISRALAELKRHGLVRVVNPAEKTGRLYELTKRGLTLRKKLS